MDSTYMGWKNYETWNVSLWIQNDERLYKDAIDSAQYSNPFHNFIAHQKSLGSVMTKDGVRWMDGRIDEDAINDLIKELV